MSAASSPVCLPSERSPHPTVGRTLLRRIGAPLLAAGLVAGLATGLAPGSAAAAPTGTARDTSRAAASEPHGHARPVAPRLNAAARRAGLAAGNATMGWSLTESAATTAHAPAPQARKSTGRDAMRAAVRSSGTVYGIDVASYQGNVNWSSQWNVGRRFAYVKATEGLSYRNPYFGSQYGGSYRQGFVRGAYHFAIPSRSSGAAQADYFVARGGAWTPDGRTLPGVLDIEYNPYGSTCYGLSRSAMVNWIASFTTRYRALTRRDAVIYTTTDWWRTCTGNSDRFATTNPLWIARYASSAGTLPKGWGYYTFWQYSGTTIDKNRFNGSYARLRVLARG